jgi:hypothetical protein
MDDQQLDRIERYLRGTMEAAEQQEFEQDLANDPQMRADLSKVRLIHEALELEIERDLRSKLNSWESRNAHTYADSKRVVMPLFVKWAIAAGLILLLGTSLWLFLAPDPVAQFAGSRFIRYDYNQLRGEETTIRNFPIPDNQRERPEAIRWMKDYISINPNDTEARFILADLLHQDKQIDEAKLHLDTLVQAQSLLWSEKAAWNYVLISVGDHWDAKADALLATMVRDATHSYHRQALELAKLME